VVDKEDLYILKSNCKGERTVGKANKGINAEEIIIGLKNKKLKLKKSRVTIYSLDVLLFLFGTSLLFHVQF